MFWCRSKLLTFLLKDSDWKELKVNSAKEGALADAVLPVKELAERYKGEAPVIATVFNPLTTAVKMKWRQNVCTHEKKS